MTYALDVNVRDLAAAFGRDVGWLDENTRKITTDATRAPLPTDDEVQGYAPGSRWLWQGQEWVAAGVAEGAAVWSPVSYGTLPSRGEAEAASVPPQIDRIGVFAPNGDALFYKRDAEGTALTTGDGAKWSPADEVTPGHFGAVGDGVTDDSGAIQAAINYLGVLKGGRLHIPAGNYKVLSTIVVNVSSIQVIGDGSAGSFNNNNGKGVRGTRIHTTATGLPALMDLGDDTYLYTGIHISGICFDANYNTVGLRLNNGCVKCTVKGNTLLRTTKGIEVLGTGPRTSFGCVITNNLIEHFKQIGIDVSGDGNELSVEYNKFMNTSANTPDAAVRVGAANEPVNGVRILNNDFGPQNVIHMIDYRNGNGFVISGNTLEASGNSDRIATALVNLGTDTTVCSDFVLIGNRYLGNNKAQYGLRLTNVNRGSLIAESFTGAYTATSRIFTVKLSNMIAVGLGHNTDNLLLDKTGFNVWMNHTTRSLYTLAAHTTTRSIDPSVITLAQLAEAVCTLVTDMSDLRLVRTS